MRGGLQPHDDRIKPWREQVEPCSLTRLCSLAKMLVLTKRARAEEVVLQIAGGIIAAQKMRELPAS